VHVAEEPYHGIEPDFGWRRLSAEDCAAEQKPDECGQRDREKASPWNGRQGA
jgi:hypothetical protein